MSVDNQRSGNALDQFSICRRLQSRVPSTLRFWPCPHFLGEYWWRHPASRPFLWAKTKWQQTLWWVKGNAHFLTKPILNELISAQCRDKRRDAFLGYPIRHSIQQCHHWLRLRSKFRRRRVHTRVELAQNPGLRFYARVRGARVRLHPSRVSLWLCYVWFW